MKECDPSQGPWVQVSSALQTPIRSPPSLLPRHQEPPPPPPTNPHPHPLQLMWQNSPDTLLVSLTSSPRSRTWCRCDDDGGGGVSDRAWQPRPLQVFLLHLFSSPLLPLLLHLRLCVLTLHQPPNTPISLLIASCSRNTASSAARNYRALCRWV
jgi:hypothetical protein